MARTVGVQEGSNAPLALNAQLIVLVIFVGIMIYLMFGGGSAKQQSSSTNTSSISAAPLLPTGTRSLPPTPTTAVSPGLGTGLTVPPSSGSARSSASPPATGNTVPPTPPSARAPPGSPGSRQSPSPRPPESRPRTPLTPNYKPGIAKWKRDPGGGESRGENGAKMRDRTITPGKTRIAWDDTSRGKPLATSRPEESLSDAESDYEYSHSGQPNRPKFAEDKHPWREHIGMTRDYHGPKFTTENLLRGVVGKPITLASMRNERIDVAHEFDPEGDDWNAAWGALPRLALGAAAKIAEVIQVKDVKKVAELMTRREQLAQKEHAKRDQSRSWLGFLVRAGLPPTPNSSLSPVQLCVAWYADYYRFTTHKERMNVNDDEDEVMESGQIIQLVKMTPELGRVARLLLWLEAMGCWTARYRLFTPSGVDIIGNGGRIAVSGTFDGSSRVYRYEKTLTIFMWSDDNDIKYWLRRVRQLNNAYDSIIMVFTGGIDAIESEKPRIETVCSTTRLVFRPGFTNREMTAAKGKWKMVDHNKAWTAPVERKPIVYRYQEPAKVWDDLKLVDWSGYARTIIENFKPEQVTIVNRRQNNWATDHADSQPLGRLHVLAILYAVGPVLHHQIRPLQDKITKEVYYHETVWDVSHSFMTLLDLTCFVPLVKRPGDPSKYDFMPLDQFRTLYQLAIPYMKHVDPERPSGDPSTLDLITSKNRGIYDVIVNRKVTDLEKRVHTFTLYVTFENPNEVALFRQEVEVFMIRTGKHNIQSAGSRGGNAAGDAEKWVHDYIATVLSKVHTVHAQSAPAADPKRGTIQGVAMSTQVNVSGILARMW